VCPQRYNVWRVPQASRLRHGLQGLCLGAEVMLRRGCFPSIYKGENLKEIEERNYKYFFKERKITSRSPLRFLGRCVGRSMISARSLCPFDDAITQYASLLDRFSFSPGSKIFEGRAHWNPVSKRKLNLWSSGSRKPRWEKISVATRCLLPMSCLSPLLAPFLRWAIYKENKGVTALKIRK